MVHIAGRAGANLIDFIQYPSLNVINHAFIAVTANMYKRQVESYQPLLELAIMLNQLFSCTYFTDLTLLLHLVALSIGVNAQVLKGEAEDALRARLANLEQLQNIFFYQNFNWFRFVKPVNFVDHMITLDKAIQMLEDYAIGCKHNPMGPAAQEERWSQDHDFIRKLAKRSQDTIILQIHYVKGELSKVPGLPANVEQLIALNYVVVKIQKSTSV